MKHLILTLLLFFCLTVQAQMTNPETLLDINNPDLTQTSTTKTFTGTPAILIEPPQRKQEPQVNPADLVPLLEPSQKATEIPIKTLFGHDRTAPYLDHTTDFVVFVQVLDDNTIQIEEQIQFVNTKPNQKFKRTLSKKITDKNGKQIFLDIQPISFYRDNHPVSLAFQNEENNLMAEYPKTLPTGINRFTIRYLVKGVIFQNKSLAEITLPLSGINWPLITERISIVLMLPQKSDFYVNELLFGANNQEIPEQFTVQSDIKGNAVYQLTRPLPAFADVRLHTIFDAKNLPKQERTLLNTTLSLLAYFGILAFYTCLSIAVCRFHKFKEILKKSKKVNPLLWRFEIGKSITPDLQKKIKATDKNLSSLKYLKHKKIGNLFAFIRFNMEYIIGVIILILSVKLVHSYLAEEMPSLIWFLLGGVLTVLTIDVFGTRPEWERFAKELKNTLTNTFQGLNLPVREIENYYILAICLDFEREWTLKLIQNNPTYRDLPFIKKEK